VKAENPSARVKLLLREAAPAWTAVVALTVLAWIVTLDQVRAMGNGAGTMGMSFVAFVAMWTAMMAAMCAFTLPLAIRIRSVTTGIAATIVDNSVPIPPATPHTTPPSGHGSAGALISVTWRIEAANSRSTSGCDVNPSHTDAPCTAANERSPVRTVSPAHAATVDCRPK